MSAPTELLGTFKVGSSFSIKLTRKAGGNPVDMTGLVTRSMFRAQSPVGNLLFTLTEGDGVVIDDPTTGVITLNVTRSQSALMYPGVKVFFDIEQTSAIDVTYEWQSLTYWFKPDAQVTQ